MDTTAVRPLFAALPNEPLAAVVVELAAIAAAAALAALSLAVAAVLAAKDGLNLALRLAWAASLSEKVLEQRAQSSRPFTAVCNPTSQPFIHTTHQIEKIERARSQRKMSNIRIFKCFR